MTYHYLIIGAGRQGTAAGYDLANFGDAKRVTMADINLTVAQDSASRINQLVGRDISVGIELDASDQTVVEKAMEGVDAVLSAVPYYFNIGITRAAIQTRTHLCDMGGNTKVVFEQIALGEKNKASGISIVPDCGMGPGLNNTMAAYVIEQFDQPREILIYDGGMPQNPQPPWNYEQLFHINGLTNEYDGETVFLRNGEITTVEGLTEHELIEIPKMGVLEAFITTGGTSTAPWTWEGKLQTYQNKTLRYPGHFDWFEGYRALGLFEENPVQMGTRDIIPREFFHTLLQPQITTSAPRDVCIMHVIGRGLKDGVDTEIIVDLIDYHDEETGFLAMERLTGWHCAIMMGFQARGKVRPGGVPMETAVAPQDFMAELPRRGLNFSVSIKTVDPMKAPAF